MPDESAWRFTGNVVPAPGSVVGDDRTEQPGSFGRGWGRRAAGEASILWQSFYVHFLQLIWHGLVVRRVTRRAGSRTPPSIRERPPVPVVVDTGVFGARLMPAGHDLAFAYRAML